MVTGATEEDSLTGATAEDSVTGTRVVVWEPLGSVIVRVMVLIVIVERTVVVESGETIELDGGGA